MTRDEAARALDETATLLELHGAEVFRVSAYRNAARALESLSEPLDKLIASGGLKGVRGIGDSLRAKLAAMSSDGHSVELDDLRAKTPEGLRQMLRIGGLGPKKVRALHTGLSVSTLAELQAACEEHRVAALKGFGAKTEEKILEGIKFIELVGQRVRFDKALKLGQALLERIKDMPGVIRAELGGSLRRRRETAKDIDILVSSDAPGPIMEAFTTLPEVMQVTGHGDTKSSIVAKLDLGGNPVILNSDLRVVKDDAFAVALLHFTGSKEHNKRLRQLAIEKGWSLNEYGLTGPGAPISFETEADVYEALGLQWVPPEMREDTGEVEASLAICLPKLVEVRDIRGVFHNHTTASDGANTLAEMVAACRELGLTYYGTGDHSQSLKVANGLAPEAVKRQWAEADAINAKLAGTFRVFKGTECDILKDGSLDYDDELLAGFDYVVASVHTYLQPQPRGTDRAHLSGARPPGGDHARPRDRDDC